MPRIDLKPERQRLMMVGRDLDLIASEFRGGRHGDVEQLETLFGRLVTAAIETTSLLQMVAVKLDGAE